MATATFTDVSVKTENVDYVRLVKMNSEGVVEKVSNKNDPSGIKYAAAGSEQITKLKESGYVEADTNTFTTYKIGTLSGLSDLIGDEEEAVNVAQRGVSQKISQKIAAFLTEYDYENQKFVNETVEGAIDTREFLQEPTQRRSLTQGEKLVRDMKKSGYADEMIALVLKTLQAAGTADLDSGEAA